MTIGMAKKKRIYENAIEDYLLEIMATELASIVKSPIGIQGKKIVTKSKFAFINLISLRCREVMSFNVNYILIDRNIHITVFLGQDYYKEVREVIPVVKASLELGLKEQNIFFKRIYWSLGST